MFSFACSNVPLSPFLLIHSMDLEEIPLILAWRDYHQVVFSAYMKPLKTVLYSLLESVFKLTVHGTIKGEGLPTYICH